MEETRRAGPLNRRLGPCCTHDRTCNGCASARQRRLPRWRLPWWRVRLACRWVGRRRMVGPSRARRVGRDRVACGSLLRVGLWLRPWFPTADMLVPTAGMATVPAIVPAILPTTFPDSGMATEGVESSNWDRVLRSSDRAPRFESSAQPAPEPAACRSADRRAVIGGAGMANFSTSTRRRWRVWRAGDALAISRPTGRFLYRRGARRRPCHPKIAPPGVSRSKRGRSRRSGDA
jgi:hypothetical protein